MPYPKPVQKIILTEDLKQKWELIKPEDFPLLTVASLEHIEKQNQKTIEILDGIKNWLTLIGVIVLCGVALAGCSVLSALLK